MLTRVGINCDVHNHFVCASINKNVAQNLRFGHFGSFQWSCMTLPQQNIGHVSGFVQIGTTTSHNPSPTALSKSPLIQVSKQQEVNCREISACHGSLLPSCCCSCNVSSRPTAVGPTAMPPNMRLRHMNNIKVIPWSGARPKWQPVDPLSSRRFWSTPPRP
jgi:hypothetical protein